MKKRALHYLSIGLMTLALLVGVAEQTNAAPASKAAPSLVLRFTSWVTPADRFGQSQEWYLKEVAKRTNGRVVFEPHWGKTLVPVKGELDALKANIVQAAVAKPDYYRAKVPLSMVGNLGGIEDDPWVAHMAFREVNRLDVLKAELAKFDAQYMAAMGTGSNFLLTVEPIKSLDEIKGMKLRGLGFALDIILGMGGIPVAMPAPELYDNLAKGVVKGCFQNWVSAKTYRSAELAKYQYMIKTGACPYYMLIRKDAWNKISPADQKIMQDLIPEHITWFVNHYSLAGPKAAKEFICKEYGCNVTKPAATEIAKVNKIAKGTWEKWVAEGEKKGQPRRMVLDAYMKACEKYRPVSPFKGKIEDY